LGYTDVPVIETLKAPSDGFISFAGREITEALLGRSIRRLLREEAAGEAAVTGAEKTSERKPGRTLPCHGRKAAASEWIRWNPRSAGGMKQARQGYR
jgi:hypothetical protein